MTALIQFMPAYGVKDPAGSLVIVHGKVVLRNGRAPTAQAVEGHEGKRVDALSRHASDGLRPRVAAPLFHNTIDHDSRAWRSRAITVHVLRRLDDFRLTRWHTFSDISMKRQFSGCFVARRAQAKGP